MTVPPAKSATEEKRPLTVLMKRSEWRQLLTLAVEGMASWRRAAEQRAGGGPQISSEDAAALTAVGQVVRKVRDEL